MKASPGLKAAAASAATTASNGVSREAAASGKPAGESMGSKVFASAPSPLQAPFPGEGGGVCRGVWPASGSSLGRDDRLGWRVARGGELKAGWLDWRLDT